MVTGSLRAFLKAIFAMIIWTAFSVFVLYLLDAHIHYREIIWAVATSISLLIVHMINMIIYFTITGKEPYKWFKAS